MVMRAFIIQTDGPDEWVGRKMELKFADGTKRSCDIVNAPFVDAEKISAAVLTVRYLSSDSQRL